MLDEFAEILKDLINERELSLRKIGKEIGFTSGQLSRWLNGSSLTIENAVKLANYFDCSLDYLFGLRAERNYASYLNKNYDFTLFLVRYHEKIIENKMNHSQFTRQSNLNESCLRDWKKGHKPLMDTMVILAKNLSCSIDHLLGRT